MAQNVLDYTYDPTGNELMDEYLPKMAENCLTNNSGSTRPTYAVENTVWVDTSDDNVWRYKIYDGTSDIVLFELDNITKKINFPNITGVFRFKGSVATVSALPATGNLPGDVYNVVDGGANYAWNGSEWDKLSENLEWGRIVGTLSNQTDLQNALDAKQPTLVSGTNIKTVNGNSLLGSGDLLVSVQTSFANITGQPSDNANLATALNAKANDSDVVKLTGDQTINGVMTLISPPLILKDTQNALSENASTNTYTDVLINDKNNIPLGIWEYRHVTGNGSGMSMVLRKRGSESSAVWSRIGIFQDTSGNFYTEAPTPATADNSTKIATTAFVKNQGYVGSANLATVHVVTQTYINGTSWYRVYDDGWCIQGGRIIPHSADVWRTCTLLKAFANTDYIVITSARQLNQNAAANYGQIYTGTYTTRGFNYKGWYNDNNNTAIEWQACGYIS